jgi:hypothetical protein
MLGVRALSAGCSECWGRRLHSICWPVHGEVGVWALTCVLDATFALSPLPLLLPTLSLSSSSLVRVSRQSLDWRWRCDGVVVVELW